MIYNLPDELLVEILWLVPPLVVLTSRLVRNSRLLFSSVYHIKIEFGLLNSSDRFVSASKP